jgi:predicted NAD/FAD-dependent oxidoreductase
MHLMDAEVLIVGAGIAGLTCARTLIDAGRSVVVWEKSRGVGGRCATRRVEKTVVDHGLTFYHGSDVRLRASLESAAEDSLVPGWPREIYGSGTPCQPGALRKGDWRLAFANGVNAFPKRLASGLDLRLNARVIALDHAGKWWRVVDEHGEEIRVRDLVLTLPSPQALDLLAPRKDEPRELRSLRSLASEIGFVPSLTVLALYPAGTPVPEWEMWYPEDSTILQLISHDSSKRKRPDRTTLVLQALPGWSREQWERPEAEWLAAMLEDAGGIAGVWAASPETVQTHRWRYARIGGGGDLTGPMLVELPEGARLGLAGDGFFPGGGVQAAWRSGLDLARRMSKERES